MEQSHINGTKMIQIVIMGEHQYQVQPIIHIEKKIVVQMMMDITM